MDLEQYTDHMSSVVLTLQCGMWVVVGCAHSNTASDDDRVTMWLWGRYRVALRARSCSAQAAGGWGCVRIRMPSIGFHWGIYDHLFHTSSNRDNMMSSPASRIYTKQPHCGLLWHKPHPSHSQRALFVCIMTLICQTVVIRHYWTPYSTYVRESCSLKKAKEKHYTPSSLPPQYVSKSFTGAWLIHFMNEPDNKYISPAVRLMKIIKIFTCHGMARLHHKTGALFAKKKSVAAHTLLQICIIHCHWLTQIFP